MTKKKLIQIIQLYFLSNLFILFKVTVSDHLMKFFNLYYLKVLYKFILVIFLISLTIFFFKSFNYSF